MSVVPKLNAGCTGLRNSPAIRGRDTRLTDSVSTIDGEEKAAKTKTMGDGNLALPVKGLEDGSVVYGCEDILRAESLSGANRRHDLFREATPFGNVFQRESGREISSWHNRTVSTS